MKAITRIIIALIVLNLAMGSLVFGETPTKDDMTRLGVTSLKKADLVPELLVVSLADSQGSSDSDGDGLSDFREIHKNFTDPIKRDSDGDGIHDGDWNERREYTYSVRTVLELAPPFNKAALNDDFQDARVLEQRDDYVKLEVIHYPLGTAGKKIEENANWQRDYAAMTQYLKPGVTTNWDAKMKEDLLEELKADGIFVENLSDKQVIEQVSSWLWKKSKYLDRVLTPYYVYYPNEQPTIYPGLEEAFEHEFIRDSENYNWSIDQHFKHFEYGLLGKGMFYNKTRGSCTSYAVYLTTVLRALGIPTRMIIVIPAVDASDEEQINLVREGITNNRVSQIMLEGLRKAGGFAAHAMNEVYVGGRWHRLNYYELGQPILDGNYFGLQTHTHTYNDLSEANLAPTWGYRYGRSQVCGKSNPNDTFEHSNPYSAITVSELFGCHRKLKEHNRITISKAYWFHSNERPDWIPHDAVKRNNDGHILFHVDEQFDGEGDEQYSTFYYHADGRFLLRSRGRPDVRAYTLRGWWGQEFYVWIPHKEYLKMEVGIPYVVCPMNSTAEYKWQVKKGATICKSTAPEPVEATKEHRYLTVSRAYWFHSSERPGHIPGNAVKKDENGHILIHIEERPDDELQTLYKRFYDAVDKTFMLKAEGHQDVEAEAERGYWGQEFYLRVRQEEYEKMVRNIPYALQPLNQFLQYQWKVKQGVTITKNE